MQGELPHQSHDRAAGDRAVFAAQLLPDLLRSVHLLVLIPHPAYLLSSRLILPPALGPPIGIPLTAQVTADRSYLQQVLGDRAGPHDPAVAERTAKLK